MVANRITQNPLIKKLFSLNLPKEDFAVFGSGPMFAHGLIDDLKDLEVIAGELNITVDQYVEEIIIKALKDLPEE